MSFPLRIPAVQVSQPIGEFFLCALPARLVRDVSYSVPASAGNSDGVLSRIFGTQRRLSLERARQIGGYIDSVESTFPSAIILSVNYTEDGELEEDDGVRWSLERNHCGGWDLIIPTDRKLASIIDGQHRLAGFAYSEIHERQDMELPCAIFFDLPKAYQANIFATINFNQKRVDKSLAYQLFGYDLHESDKNRWTPSLVALYIARVLNGEAESPFRGHIKLALAESAQRADDHPKPGEWAVSIAAMVEGIEKLISSNPAADRNRLLSKKGLSRSDLGEDKRAPLRQLYLASDDRAIYSAVEAYFRGIDYVVWKQADSSSFISRTVGILACFDVLRIGLLKNCVQLENAGSWVRDAESVLSNIDFKDDYFHASGAGRVRIRNVLLVALRVVDVNELRDAETKLTVLRLVGHLSESSGS